MATAWLETLKKAQKTCLVQDGKKKVHYKFDGGVEMAEEYDTRTNELLVRKWKRKGTLAGSKNWDFEVGEAPMNKTGLEAEGLMESSANPIFSRKDTKKAFQWRIRNLPYPLETYDVRVDDECKNIVIRTTNKKYYKKYGIPDMERLGLLLSQDNISIAHATNTLIVTYNKPPEVLDVETQLLAELKKMKAATDGDVECTPS